MIVHVAILVNSGVVVDVKPYLDSDKAFDQKADWRDRVGFDGSDDEARVFTCKVEGEPDENVPDSGAGDVEVIHQPLTQVELDQKLKDAGICKFGEVKRDG